MPSEFYPDYPAGALHPDSEAALSEIRAGQGLPLSAQTPEEARASFLDPSWLGEPAAAVRIEHHVVPGPGGPIPVRVYASGDAHAVPVILFFHGGGFVLGHLDEFDAFCSCFAGPSRKVVSVGYRLAPEAKCPAAIEDAMAATRWVAGHAEALDIDPARIVVMGDSAGGNLAAITALRIRDQGGADIAQQILICPWLDLTTMAEDAPSFRHFGGGPWLSTANIHWYRGHYLSGEEQSLSVSPLRAGDLSGLPPALILTAEFDVLADQGEAYAHRLRAAGGHAVCTRYPGMLHDFVTLPGKFSVAWEAIRQITSAVDARFRTAR